MGADLKVGAGRPRPFYCVVCKQRGHYYGRLVWPEETEPTCPNHKVPQQLLPV